MHVKKNFMSLYSQVMLIFLFGVWYVSKDWNVLDFGQMVILKQI